MPESLPGYLINLTGEFTVGNDVIATADSSTTMGTALLSEMGYWQPGIGWQTSRNTPVSGEYRAIALDLQGVSAAQVQALQGDLEATQQALANEDYASLTKQALVGDLLYSTILGYFALNNVQDRIAERQSGSIGYRAPSYGLFRTSLTPEYWYDLPRNVRADGLGMDVDRAINQRVDRHNNADNWVAFNRAQGSRMSAMEHLVPEQMFSTEAAPANGISAVKAIQLAAAEEQRIYTITRANVDAALAQINLSSDIEAEIRNAAQAGLEITAHQQPVSFFGRPSVGYIILDPVTATGAYKIGGGENGAKISPPEYPALATAGMMPNLPEGGWLEFIAIVATIISLASKSSVLAAVLLVLSLYLLWQEYISDSRKYIDCPGAQLILQGGYLLALVLVFLGALAVGAKEIPYAIAMFVAGLIAIAAAKAAAGSRCEKL